MELLHSSTHSNHTNFHLFQPQITSERLNQRNITSLWSDVGHWKTWKIKWKRFKVRRFRWSSSVRVYEFEELKLSHGNVWYTRMQIYRFFVEIVKFRKFDESGRVMIHSSLEWLVIYAFLHCSHGSGAFLNFECVAMTFVAQTLPLTSRRRKILFKKQFLRDLWPRHHRYTFYASHLYCRRLCELCH